MHKRIIKFADLPAIRGESEKIMTNTEIIEAIENSNVWDYEMCAEACERAGLSDEWEAADGETFEAVVDKAIEILKKA